LNAVVRLAGGKTAGWLGAIGPLYKLFASGRPDPPSGVELRAFLRYRGSQINQRQPSRPDAGAFSAPAPACTVQLRAPMSTTFDKVADIIAETCDIPRETITPDSHAIDDLKIDSLDFLDIAFAIDKAFGIKLPLEQWTQKINDGQATTEQYFVLKNLCARIDELIAAKGA
jgi:acyl carrier protein